MPDDVTKYGLILTQSHYIFYQDLSHDAFILGAHIDHNKLCALDSFVACR
ncbi:MAG: hypothetical protein WC378_13835 [Opitutaceae bacterium]